jgi:hydrogenase maturation protease
MSLSLQEIGLRPSESVLVYGIGNVGRQDDGIGVRLVERLERDARHAGDEGDSTEGATFETNYQLGIEDALLLSKFDVVLFLDASCEPISTLPFTVRPVVPSDQIAFTTHAMSFSSVLSICEELYGRKPRTFLVAIRGYEWGISEDLSPNARMNLDDAFASLSAILQSCGRAHRVEPRGDGSRSAYA